jgi:hypothetical protein
LSQVSYAGNTAKAVERGLENQVVTASNITGDEDFFLPEPSGIKKQVDDLPESSTQKLQKD